MEKRDFSNDTLLQELAVVFKGMSKADVLSILPRIDLYVFFWDKVYQLPDKLRLKFFEATIQVYFCLHRHGQIGNIGGFDDDVCTYLQKCIEHIREMNR